MNYALDGPNEKTTEVDLEAGSGISEDAGREEKDGAEEEVGHCGNNDAGCIAMYGNIKTRPEPHKVISIESADDTIVLARSRSSLSLLATVPKTASDENATENALASSVPSITTCVCVNSLIDPTTPQCEPQYSIMPAIRTPEWLYKDPLHLRKAPLAGWVSGGYSYKGGDPTQRDSWVKE